MTGPLRGAQRRPRRGRRPAPCRRKRCRSRRRSRRRACRGRCSRRCPPRRGRSWRCRRSGPRGRGGPGPPRCPARRLSRLRPCSPGPHLGRADLRGRLGQVGRHLAVQPGLGHTVGEDRSSRPGRGVRAAGDRLPELRGPLPILRQGRAPHAVQPALDAGAGHFAQPTGLGGGLGAADDERQPGGVRVVVAVRDEPGDVEQSPVQLSRADVGQDGVGTDVGGAVDDRAGETRGGAVGALEGTDLRAVGGGGDGDLVTGDGGDGAGAAAAGRLDGGGVGPGRPATRRPPPWRAGRPGSGLRSRRTRPGRVWRGEFCA